jgi:transposase
LRDTERRVGELDARLAAQARADAVCQRLMTIPGIGPITATALAATIGDATVFSSGRHLAAWPWRARLAVRCARRSDTGQVGTKRDRSGQRGIGRTGQEKAVPPGRRWMSA